MTDTPAPSGNKREPILDEILGSRVPTAAGA